MSGRPMRNMVEAAFHLICESSKELNESIYFQNEI